LATDADKPGPEGDATAGRLPLAFLAVSYSADADPAPGDPGGENRVLAAAAMLTDRCPQTVGNGTRVWLHGSEPWVTTRSDGSFTALLSRSPCPEDLTARLGGLLGKRRQHPMAIDSNTAHVLRGITPPFGMVTCAGPGRPVLAATDLMGCRHLYWHQGRGWAAVSTSALALATCASAAPDPDAMAVRSMLGFHLGTSSPFTGVRKFGPAGLCTLSRGQVHVTQYADPWPEPSWPGRAAPAPADLARGITGLLRSCGTWIAEEFPDALIELSGGLDSRVQLAAIPAVRRPGMQGVTLDAAGTRDSEVAQRIAGITALDHRVLSLSPLAELTPAEAWALVRRSAIRDDCSANPISHGVLDWAEDRMGTQPRVHGAGGETARGFYYLGQRQHAKVTGRLTSRLARWRLMTNEAVDAGCLGPDMASWVRGRATAEVRHVLEGYHCDWLTAIDEFYTRERVVRWAGLRLSASSTERTVLSSMLHPDFVALARACPPSLKRNSRFMSMVLAELDANLARIPLDSGRVPASLARPTILGRARSYPVTGRKVVSKIHQRIAAAGQPGVGQAVLGRLVLEHWRSEPDLLTTVPGTGLADETWVRRLLDGTCQADPATVGYLANVLVMSEMTAVDPVLAASARPAGA
jgi:asparagine synthase (glutamine-hydrolysing)